MTVRGSALPGVGGRVISCPVVVHRWFRSGEGLAWGQEDTPQDFVECLKNLLGSRPTAAQVGLVPAEAGCWFYHHTLDAQPMDPKAQGRHPSILRAVALPGRPRPEHRQELVRRLLEVPLPDEPGNNTQLFLKIPATWLEAETKQVESPTGQSSGSLSRPWRWILSACAIAIIVIIMIEVIVATGIIDGYTGVLPHAGVSKREVQDQLLRPLAVHLEDSASTQEVCERFRLVYCQRGMIEHFFPSASIDEIKQAVQGADKGSSLHPDALFVRQYGDTLRKFWSIVANLPEIPPHDSRGSTLPGDKLRQLVNEVAKRIPENQRRQNATIVADRNGIKILAQAVVGSLREAGLLGRQQRSRYEQWFLEEFQWRRGERFPWDWPVDDRGRRVALVFSRQERIFSEERGAADKMREWLIQRGVAGISERDVQERPWFVGRCFVEFLSLKHLDLSGEQRTRLEQQGSVVWKQLGKLPTDGWPVGESGRRSAPDRPWEVVRQRARELAEKLDAETSEDDAILVQRITNSIEEWLTAYKSQDENIKNALFETEREESRLKQEISNLDNKIRELDRDIGELEKLSKALSAYTDEWSQTVNQINDKKSKKKLNQVDKTARERKLAELKRRREELSQAAQVLMSSEDRVNELWRRLTGGKEIPGRSDTKEQ